MTEFADHSRDIATRMVRAERDFCSRVRDIIGCSHEEAMLVLKYLRHIRAVTEDHPSATISVKHGAFWSAAVLRAALKCAWETPPKDRRNWG